MYVYRCMTNYVRCLPSRLELHICHTPHCPAWQMIYAASCTHTCKQWIHRLCLLWQGSCSTYLLLIVPEAGQHIGSMCSAIWAHWRIVAKDVCSDSVTINHYNFRCGFCSLWWWHNSTGRRTGVKNLVSKLWGVVVLKGCQPHYTAHFCSLPCPSNEVVFHIPPNSFIN